MDIPSTVFISLLKAYLPTLSLDTEATEDYITTARTIVPLSSSVSSILHHVNLIGSPSSSLSSSFPHPNNRSVHNPYILQGITRTHIEILFFGNEHYVNEFFNLLSVELRNYYYYETQRSITVFERNLSARPIAWNRHGQPVRWINNNLSIPLLPQNHIPNFRNLRRRMFEERSLYSSLPEQKITFLSPLCYAVLVNNLPYLKHYFATDTTATVNQLYTLFHKSELSLLHYAVITNRTEIISYLLTLGANVNLGGKLSTYDHSTYSITPVGLAILLQHSDILRTFIHDHQGIIGNSLYLLSHISDHNKTTSTIMTIPPTRTTNRSTNNTLRTYDTFLRPSITTHNNVYPSIFWDIFYIYISSHDSVYKCEPFSPISTTLNLANRFHGESFFRCLSNQCIHPCIHTHTLFHHQNFLHRYPIIPIHHTVPSTDTRHSSSSSSRVVESFKFQKLFHHLRLHGYGIETYILPYHQWLNHRNNLVQFILERILHYEHAPIEKVFSAPFIERIIHQSGEDESFLRCILQTLVSSSPRIIQESIATNFFHGYAVRITEVLKHYEQMLQLVRFRFRNPRIIAAQGNRTNTIFSSSSSAVYSALSDQDNYMTSRIYLPSLNYDNYNQLIMNTLQRLYHHPILLHIGENTMSTWGTPLTKLDLLDTVATILHDELLTMYTYRTYSTSAKGAVSQSTLSVRVSNVYVDDKHRTPSASPPLPQLSFHSNDEIFLKYILTMLVEFVTILRMGNIAIHHGASIIQETTTEISVPQPNPFGFGGKGGIWAMYKLFSTNLNLMIPSPEVTKYRTVLLSILPSVRTNPFTKAIFRYWIGVRAWKRRKYSILRYQ